jgi:hypothetical protein
MSTLYQPLTQLLQNHPGSHVKYFFKPVIKFKPAPHLPAVRIEGIELLCDLDVIIIKQNGTWRILDPKDEQNLMLISTIYQRLSVIIKN